MKKKKEFKFETLDLQCLNNFRGGQEPTKQTDYSVSVRTVEKPVFGNSPTTYTEIEVELEAEIEIDI